MTNSWLASFRSSNTGDGAGSWFLAAPRRRDSIRSTVSAGVIGRFSQATAAVPPGAQVGG